VNSPRESPLRVGLEEPAGPGMAVTGKLENRHAPLQAIEKDHPATQASAGFLSAAPRASSVQRGLGCATGPGRNGRRDDAG